MLNSERISTSFITWVTDTETCVCIAAAICFKQALINAMPFATLFVRVGESRVVGAAQWPALSYGSLKSEQTSDRMGHSDEPETWYRHIQQYKCIVLKRFHRRLALKICCRFNRTLMFPVVLGSN